MEFKDRLRQLRNEKGMSTTEFGATFERSDGAIRMWETGHSKPDADTLIALAKYFDCTVDYLLGVPDGTKEIYIVKGVEAYTNDELLKEINKRLRG